MVAGFDRYFQIAPCFRDEDARADRSPGEFYQLDVELSFVTQDDVFAAIEPVLAGVFSEFSDWTVSAPPFPRIAYDDAMAMYGSDKPDLRNPIKAADVTEIFRGSEFAVFARAVEEGAVVRAIRAPGAAEQSRSFFDKTVGLGGVARPRRARVHRRQRDAEGAAGEVPARERRARLFEAAGVEPGDAVFFAAGTPKSLTRPVDGLRAHLAPRARPARGERLPLLLGHRLSVLRARPETNQIAFSHNPFSMPQGGLEALNSEGSAHRSRRSSTTSSATAWSCRAARSGTIGPTSCCGRSRLPGYGPDEVRSGSAGCSNAFRYGAPPHGGLAPGIDRIVMLLAQEPNLREVIAFPMTQNAEDLLMSAPSPVSEKQLRELHIRTCVEPSGKS